MAFEKTSFRTLVSSPQLALLLQIVTVHVPTGQVTEVLFPPAAIEILMVDSSTDVLVAWNANSDYAALLQDLNATTGKTSQVFTASLDLSANGGKPIVMRTLKHVSPCLTCGC